jgi:hypothetical protein
MNNNRLPPPHSLSAALERLPMVARRKYRALQSIVDDAGALTKASMARESDIESAIGDLRRRLAFVDLRTERFRSVELKEEIEALGVELEQIKAERSKRNSVRSNTEQVLAQLNVHIPALAAQRLRAATTVAQPEKGETLANAILRVRSEIKQARGDLYQLKAAPLPRAEIEQQIRAHVQQLVRDGTPRLDLRGGAVKVYWPDKAGFSATGSAPAGAASALFAWLFPQQVYEMLIGGVDETIVGGVSSADRISVGAEIEASIRTLGHQEESLIVAALAAGIEVHRRYDASPFALLGVESVDEVPVIEEPETEQITEAAE